MIKFRPSLLFLSILFATQVLGDVGLKDVYDIYMNCAENTTMEECLSAELASGLETLEHQEKIPVLGGLELVRNSTQDNSSVNQEMLKEDEVEESTPRASHSRQDALDELILKKIYNILRAHSLRFSSEEGRGKSKIGKAILPFLLGVMLKLGAFLPMVLSVLKVLAFKALLASKTALVLSAILGVKNLLDNQREHQGSQKAQVHHIHANPVHNYGEFSGHSDLLRLGEGGQQYEEHQQLSDSRSEYSALAPGVYGRSLQSEDANSNSKVRKRSITSLHGIIHKTRTFLA